MIHACDLIQDTGSTCPKTLRQTFCSAAATKANAPMTKPMALSCIACLCRAAEGASERRSDYESMALHVRCSPLSAAVNYALYQTGKFSEKSFVELIIFPR